MCLLLSIVPCLGCTASQWLPPAAPVPSWPVSTEQLQRPLQNANLTVYILPAAIGIKSKLLTRERVLLPRLPILCGPKPHLLALQGQAPIRQATPLQDVLPATLPSSHTPTWLILPLDVHLNDAFPRKLSLDRPVPQMKTNLGLVPAGCSQCILCLLHESTLSPACHHSLKSASQLGGKCQEGDPVYPASPEAW